MICPRRSKTVAISAALQKFVIGSRTRTAIVSVRNDRLLIDFDQPQADVTPGQFAVIYDGERCLGGAVIDHGIRDQRALLKTG